MNNFLKQQQKFHYYIFPSKTLIDFSSSSHFHERSTPFIVIPVFTAPIFSPKQLIRIQSFYIERRKDENSKEQHSLSSRNSW